ncbi:MAG: peptidoglycan-binding protein [Eubacterium sp.]
MDEKIATVSSKGTIKGVKPGKAKITVTAKDGSGKKGGFFVRSKYQRDKKYYPVTEEIKLPSGGYSISTKNIGLKVIRVNKKLLHSSSDRYTYRTKEAVKRFQRKKGLKVTGIVNKKTWLKMGLSEKDWYDLGTYRTPLKVDEKSSRKDYTNAMLKTAAEYAKAGTAYRVGCSGKPGTLCGLFRIDLSVPVFGRN